MNTVQCTNKLIKNKLGPGWLWVEKKETGDRETEERETGDRESEEGKRGNRETRRGVTGRQGGGSRQMW